jgi:outer membrane protein assembly factor BamB
MPPHPSRRKLICVPALALAAALAVGCVSVSPEDQRPLLVTQPPTLEPTPTPTLPPPTPTPVAPTSAPYDLMTATPSGPAGGVALDRLWEWSDVARPTALAGASSRLAALTADGRFTWLNAETGDIESNALLWLGASGHETWGEVFTDGTLAAIVYHESSADPESGALQSRSRLSVLDSVANEQWSLPTLVDRRFYTAALSPVSVIVGTYSSPPDSLDTLGAYEIFSGDSLWEVGDEPGGYRAVAHDGTRLYALLNPPTGAAVASYDLRTGDELWRWADESLGRANRLLMGESRVFVLTDGQVIALDPASGRLLWSTPFRADPDGGASIHADRLYLVPAPSAESGFRPGVVSLDAASGALVWNALSGLRADALAVGDQTLWAIVKDFDRGRVYLSGLNPEDGLEQVRIEVGTDTRLPYRLLVEEGRVYVLGERLIAFDG